MGSGIALGGRGRLVWSVGVRCVLLFLLGMLALNSSATGQERRFVEATIFRDTGTKTDSAGYSTHTFDVVHGWIDDQGAFRVRASSVGYEVDLCTDEEKFCVKAATFKDACVVLSASLPEIGQPVRKTLRRGKDWYGVVPVKSGVR